MDMTNRVSQYHCFSSFRAFIKKALNIFIVAVTLVVSSLTYSQNNMDRTIKDSILPFLNTERINDEAEYTKVKSILKRLEKQYGYETNIRKRLLSVSYMHGDLNFFKEEMARLVEYYGFNVAYMSGDENYYKAIIEGDLSKWFKSMYIKNHSKWLDKNFDMQIELKKMNEIHEKDQFLTGFAMKVLSIPSLDSIQKEEIKIMLSDYYFKNINAIYSIVKKRNFFPNEKNFAVLQSGYDTALIHNFQFKGNIERTWFLFYPTIKKAYLRNEITNVIFQNYDFYSYLSFGYQEFGSWTIDKIPEQFRKSNDEIPLKDEEEFKKIKKEFNWE